MIEKTGIIYSENSDLSNSQTIEQAGEQSSLTVPNWPAETDLYVKAYCVESGQTYESTIEHYITPADFDYLYIENDYAGTNTITLTTTKSGSPVEGNYATSVEYSKDKTTWTTLTLVENGTNTITMDEGEKVYFRNSGGNWNYKNVMDMNLPYWTTTFSASENHNVGGKTNSLIGAYLTPMPGGNGYATFMNLFKGDTKLIDSSNLKLNGLIDSYNCFEGIFYGCTAMTTTPVMGIGSYAYSNEFRDAFKNCRSITTAPALPATIIRDSAYYGMFEGCTSLTTAPVLPATNLNNGNNFQYGRMFYGCSSLNDITIYANSVASSTTAKWVYGVAGSGTFHNLGSVTYSTGQHGVPSGWTIVNS